MVLNDEQRQALLAEWGFDPQDPSTFALPRIARHMANILKMMEASIALKRPIDLNEQFHTMRRLTHALSLLAQLQE